MSQMSELQTQINSKMSTVIAAQAATSPNYAVAISHGIK